MCQQPINKIRIKLYAGRRQGEPDCIEQTTHSNCCQRCEFGRLQGRRVINPTTTWTDAVLTLKTIVLTVAKAVKNDLVISSKRSVVEMYQGLFSIRGGALEGRASKMKERLKRLGEQHIGEVPRENLSLEMMMRNRDEQGLTILTTTPIGSCLV
jgi:hypothetical protein